MAQDSLLGGNIGPLLILFVILGMVIVYALIVSPVEREKLIGTIPYERDAINTVPGEIIPIPSATYKLTHDLADVEANFAPQAIPQILSAQITITRSTISNKDAKYAIDVNKTNLVAANILLVVTDKMGDKELVVELNNNIVFSGVLPGGKASIPLPISQLNEGSNNLRISAASPGLSFSTTTYYLRDVSFVEQKYKPEQASATQIFTLTQQEMQGVSSAKFIGYIRKLAQPVLLSLSLNNKSIYSASLYSDTPVELELPISLLNSSNILTWTADQNGDYKIAFGQIKTVYAKSPFKIKSYSFFVTDIETQAKKEGKVTCNLEITASESVTQALAVQINTYKFNLWLSNGNLTFDACPYLIPGENLLSVQSATSVYLSKLRLLMAGKAPGV